MNSLQKKIGKKEPKQRKISPNIQGPSNKDTYFNRLTTTLTRSDTPVIGKVNGEGQMFTSAEKEVYEEYRNVTRPHRKQVLILIIAK